MQKPLKSVDELCSQNNTVIINVTYLFLLSQIASEKGGRNPLMRMGKERCGEEP